MDEKRLQEIEERVAKATPGPWAAVGVDRRPYISHTWRVQDPNFMNLANFIDAEDAAFIAGSRQDIPDLLAEVRQLQADLAEMIAQNAMLSDFVQMGHRKVNNV